jgi:hypothetical protein
LAGTREGFPVVAIPQQGLGQGLCARTHESVPDKTAIPRNSPLNKLPAVIVKSCHS